MAAAVFNSSVVLIFLNLSRIMKTFARFFFVNLMYIRVLNGNLGKWENIFRSEKSQQILNRLQKPGKITQNTEKQMSFGIFLCYFNEMCVIC